MSLIYNKRTKLSATALNGTALASIAAGFITPLAAISFDVPGSAARGALTTTLFALARLVTRGVLHVAARYLLGSLRA